MIGLIGVNTVFGSVFSTCVLVCLRSFQLHPVGRFELSSTNIPKDKRPLTYY